MRAFVLAFALAALLSAAFTPIVRRLALRVGAVSRPGGRNVNADSVPRLGGLAVVVAFILPVVAILPLESSVALMLRADGKRVGGLLVGALALALLGDVDDLRRVRPVHKLAVHALAATVAYFTGFQIHAVQIPLVGELSMGIFALPVTILWIVGIVNAINLIDGLDGLAAGVVFFAGLTCFTVAMVSHNVFVAAMMAPLLGALLGFLFFNFNPARIFMGDSGSYFLGFLIGTTSLAGPLQKTSAAVSIMMPILALGLPIFDTLFSIVRRVLERRSPFSPDRGHVHHRLLAMGLTHKRAVLILYGICIALTAAAIAVSLGQAWQAGLAMLGASIVILGLVRFVGYFDVLLQGGRQRARLRSEHAEALRSTIRDTLSALRSASSEEAAFRAVAKLLASSGLFAAEVLDQAGGRRVWGEHGTIPTGTEVKSLSFPLGSDHAARSHVRFQWRSETGEIDLQVEILLQVVVDALTESLIRSRSSLAPETPPRVAGHAVAETGSLGPMGLVEARRSHSEI
jgi:UDP-GlcNAc:undecaprenyl-phosphate GlcNAc-1-phosphate transferase